MGSIPSWSLSLLGILPWQVNSGVVVTNVAEVVTLRSL